MQAQFEKGETMQDLIVPDRIETGIQDINQRALSLQITNDDTYREAGSLFVLIGDMEKEILNFMNPLIDKAHQTHKALTNARGQELAKLLPGKNYLNKGMVKYREEQKKKAEEQAIKLREEQRKKEDELRLQAALEAEKDGDKVTAEAILNETVIVEPVKPIETPEPEGVSFRENWEYEIINFKVLVEAVAKNKVPLNVLEPNKVVLRQLINSLKENMKFPGIKIWKETLTVKKSSKC